jgi:hypothetical protein
MSETELLAKTDRELMLLIHSRLAQLEARLPDCVPCLSRLGETERRSRFAIATIGTFAVVGLGHIIGEERALKWVAALRGMI